VGEPHPDLELKSRANIGTSVFFFFGELFLAVTKKKITGEKFVDCTNVFLGFFWRKLAFFEEK
jgi:hypothetical protein